MVGGCIYDYDVYCSSTVTICHFYRLGGSGDRIDFNTFWAASQNISLFTKWCQEKSSFNLFKYLLKLLWAILYIAVGLVIFIAIVHAIRGCLPHILPKFLRSWKWLPAPLRSLEPYDRAMCRKMGSIYLRNSNYCKMSIIVFVFGKVQSWPRLAIHKIYQIFSEIFYQNSSSKRFFIKIVIFFKPKLRFFRKILNFKCPKFLLFWKKLSIFDKNFNFLIKSCY